ncbi:MAG: glycosyltransferase family 2 protein [Chloroflexi bacterium]|jgi:glycosyltransferase involved in cell wall biosynthesis|nr:glycosyltransferase family 2 protein [Chloroflexota bacterium]
MESPPGVAAGEPAGTATSPQLSAERLLALVPAHDEGPRITAVVTAARTHLPVLVVDDGSADDTAARAKAAGALVFRQVPNRGKGAALQAGFRWALDEGWDAVITLDADGQHDPAEIPRFVDAWRAGRPDLVIGRRDFRRMPPSRRLANEIGGRAFSWAVGRPIPDNQSGYRLLSRRLMAEMIGSQEGGFELEVDMIVVCLRAGWPLAWVPISTIYAGEPSHIRPVRHVTGFLRTVKRARARMRAPGP